jgi:glycyl-tRNA synthetase beta chain
MVGELPELQGEVGRAYALHQGVEREVADVIRDHYRPKGASDATAAAPAAALVALADRLDTLVGCFAVGLSPSGGADPYGLRRACLGVLRTLLDQRFDLELGAAFAAAYAGFGGVELDLDEATLVDKLSAFFRDRLRGVLTAEMATDAVDAALGAGAARPLDARARAAALLQIDAATRRSLGEVFKRATNIAKTAPEGEPERGPEPAEQALHDAFMPLREKLRRLAAAGDYVSAFAELAALAPLLHTYFLEVFVMAEDETLRDNRLRLMRTISDSCGALARLELLGEVSEGD